MSKGISPNRYSAEEINYIKDNLPLKPAIEIAKDLGRCYKHVRDKIYLLGLRTVTNRIYWYTNIKQYLKQNRNNFNLEHFRESFMIPKRLNIIKDNTKIIIINSENKEEIKCRICNNFFELTSFHKSNGKVVNNVCRACKSLYENSLITSPKKLLKRLLMQTYSRTKNKQFCDITLDYLEKIYTKQEGKCALTGIMMDYIPKERRNFNAISIDRIDSGKEYIEGNIQLVCLWANYAKNTLNLEDFKSYINTTYKYLNNTENA